MADDVTTHQRLAVRPTLTAARDPLGRVRIMAQAAGFGDRVDLLIIAQARGHRIIPEGRA